MPDPIEPQALLDQAWTALQTGPRQRFVSPERDRGNQFEQEVLGPAAADLRQAVSSAYYGLFHALTLASASLFAPSSDSRHELVRLFNHRDVSRVTTWVAGGSPPEGLQRSIEALRADVHVVKVSEFFQQLYKARQDADYNHAASFDFEETVRHVSVAQVALLRVQDPAFADSPAGRLFLGLVALRARGGGG